MIWPARIWFLGAIAIVLVGIIPAASAAPQPSPVDPALSVLTGMPSPPAPQAAAAWQSAPVVPAPLSAIVPASQPATPAAPPGELFGQLAAFATLCVFIGACARGFGILDRLAVIWLVIVAIFVLALNRMSMVDTGRPFFVASDGLVFIAIFGGAPLGFPSRPGMGVQGKDADGAG